MRKHLFIVAGGVVLVAAWALANVRLEFPPGPPYYAQFSNLDPYGEEIYHTEEWAAIPFYRDPSCVPGAFNLLDFFDAPRVFQCALKVGGFEIWAVPPWEGGPGPIQARIQGLGAVPIYFVSWPELRAAVVDRVLTMDELRALPSLKIGYATFYSSNLHPSGGSANVPHIQIVATGVLQDGKQFQFQVAGGDQSALVKHVRIVFW